MDYMEYSNFNKINNLLKNNNMLILDNNILIDKDQDLNKNDYLLTDGYWHGKNESGPEVIYKINKDGFRSQNFKALKKEDINIVYGGCSITFGQGLPVEHTWTKQLTNKIQNKNTNKKIEDFNLAFNGFSIDIIIKNLFSFINNNGIPDYIFLCLPDIARRVGFSIKKNKYIQLIPSLNTLKNSKDPMQIRYTIDYQYQNNIFIYSIMLHMLEKYCKDLNINLFWSTWSLEDEEIFKQIGFNNFVENNIEIMPSLTYSNNLKEEDIPYWKIAQDGSHPGSAWNYYMSDLFFRKVAK